MDFSSLLEAINMLLDRLVTGAKLQPKTTPDTLAAELASAVSLLLGVDPDAPEDKRPIGPVDDDQAGFAQMSGLMGYTIREFSRVLNLLNQLLSAAKLTVLPTNTKPQELAGALTRLIMDDLQKQLAAGPDVAQMGGRLARVSSKDRKLSKSYETFKAAGYGPEKALRMARNVARP